MLHKNKSKSGSDLLTVRENKLAKFNRSGEVGYWKLERRPVPGTPKRKIPLSNEGMDVLVLDVPEQGDRKNLIVSYEVWVATICFERVFIPSFRRSPKANALSEFRSCFARASL